MQMGVTRTKREIYQVRSQVEDVKLLFSVEIQTEMVTDLLKIFLCKLFRYILQQMKMI
jgi:hypothetical protein